MDLPELSAEDVAKKAMNIAADMCVYTNKQFILESLATSERQPKENVDAKDSKP